MQLEMARASREALQRGELSALSAFSRLASRIALVPELLRHPPLSDLAQAARHLRDLAALLRGWQVESVDAEFS